MTTLQSLESEFEKEFADLIFGGDLIPLDKEKHARVRAFIRKAYLAGMEEKETKVEVIKWDERNRIIRSIKDHIGFLRQWLNEKPEGRLVTNEDLEYWLFDHPQGRD